MGTNKMMLKANNKMRQSWQIAIHLKDLSYLHKR